jgi:transposase
VLTSVEPRDEIAELRAQIAERDQRIAEREARLAENEACLADYRQRVELLEREVARVGELEEQITLLEEQLENATGDKAALEARLKDLLARRRALGHDALGQLTLAFCGEPPVQQPPCAKEAPDGETAQDILRPRHVRRHAPRKLAYAALPREHVQHELPVSERTCAVTGTALVVIGEKTSEQLEYRPAQLVVVVHHRAVYGLSDADRAERTVEPVVAPGPVQPIEDARVGPSLLSWILIQKYGHHLPLYRQQAIFEREGLAIPRQTMCDWVLACAFQLEPIQRAMKKRILESGVVQLDDTPVDCQGPPGEENFQARLWTYLSPLEPCVVFDFALDRGHEHVLDFLGQEISGYLVGDGYSGYGTIAKKRPGIIEAGCWAHALRKCRDALKESPAEAAALLVVVRSLFRIEVEAVEQGLDADGVKSAREARSQDVLERIREQVRALRQRPAELSQQSALSKALTYIENQWDALTAFLGDGRVPIHNNSCERAIRPIAVGRKNWLFAGSERGGAAAATVYSLIESCRRVGVDPYEYLRDVLVRVAIHPAARVDELAPDRWAGLFGHLHLG